MQEIQHPGTLHVTLGTYIDGVSLVLVHSCDIWSTNISNELFSVHFTNFSCTCEACFCAHLGFLALTCFEFSAI